MLYRYKGEIVSVYKRGEVSPEKLRTLKEDAERIMGLRPALRKNWIENHEKYMNEKSEYLTPPPEGDSTREYAERILALEPPVVEIWMGYPVIVSLSELEPIPGYS